MPSRRDRDAAEVVAEHLESTAARPVLDTAAVREIAVPDSVECLAELVVEAWYVGTGRPLQEAKVVALAVGAPAQRDEALPSYSVPTGDLANATSCRLLVPSPGVYDLFVLGRHGRAMQSNVVVDGDQRLLLPVPEPQKVRVRWAEADPPSREFAVGFELVELAPWEAAERWDDLSPQEGATLGPNMLETTVLVAGGLGERLVSSQCRVRPERFVPPADLEVSRGAEHAQLNVVTEFADPHRTWPDRRTLCVRFQAGGRERSHEVWIDPGRALSTIAVKVDARVPEHDGRLRWEGLGIVADEVAYTARDVREGAPVRALLRVEDLPPVDREFRLAWPEDTAPTVMHGWSTDDARGEIDHSDGIPGEPFLVRAYPDWILAAADLPGAVAALVAGPTRAPGTGPADLTLRRGGFLVLAPDALPPEEVGTLTIERSDGAPLLARSEYGPYATARVPVDRGTVLGPFEPGEILLDVRVAGHLWRRFAVTIREGGSEILRLPALRHR